jgi:CubicO group peptidase (beta-lactamase class C family)
VGTTSVVLALVRDGRLSLTDPVARFIPEFSGGGREGVTVEHLLTHSSGLPAWKPIYREARGYDEVLREVIHCPLEREPGTRETYSDLGFILLGEVAARAAGCSLPTLERGAILEPLHLRDTLRNPPEEMWERAVPTEKRPLWEGGDAPLVATRGIVHDENAAAGDGVTGQAGLFSTADDLAAFAAELLRGYRGASSLFPEDVVREFVARRNLVPGSTRALGWDTPARGSSAGDLLSPRSFGHTGFTGGSLWIDPDRDLYILLLSNRVYPTRENLKILRVRRELADAVVSCADGAPGGS